MDEIKREKELWEKDKLAKNPVSPAKTSSGIEAAVVYTPADLEGSDYLQDLGFPGQFPFTRGIYPSMYRGNLWSMRQYAGFADAEESNRRFKYLLEQGQTGLSVAFDLPTQMGFDSDNPLVRADVGRVGVAIDTLRDMEILFEGIPLDKITTSFTINATAAIILAMYLAVAEKQGVPLSKVGGTLQNEILKEYIARGTFIFPPTPSIRLVVDIIEFCKDRVSRMNTINFSGYHVREAGANAIQEAAYCLSSAITYVEEVLKRGIGIDDFAPRIAFHLIVGLDFFEEIAKIRATRRLWARIAKERFKSKNPKSMMLRLFCGSSAREATSKEPLNNIIRATIDMMGIVFAGAQSASILSYDEAYTIPTEESALLSLRTQQIIGYETGIANVADPLGGSYYLESLTNRMEQEIKAVIDEIDAAGGMLRCIETGKIQMDVLKSAYEIEKKKQSGERVIVGVNKFVDEQKQDEEIVLTNIDLNMSRQQVERLKRVKAERDNKKVERALLVLEEKAKSAENLVPFIQDAVKEYATVGEISDTLRKIFGEHQESVIL
ncbi:MAG: methylmalonyl-CoA mutase family protein [Syntrophales bacterium]|jgi:methylmalonyl-CoA mutase N-terminal domain/subunit|nr:methylmalonyl-CoA mutase family protein [Syntrophales bacterium]